MAQQNPIATPQSEDVTPVARDVFLDTLLQRQEVGIETYGVSLQSHNGRDAIQDAIEEAVDLWQYLIQIKMERADLERRLEETRVVTDAYVEAWKQYVLVKRMAPECATCFKSLEGARKDLAIARARLIDLTTRTAERD